jgi:hypothetical protein
MASQSHRMCVADSSVPRHLLQIGSSVNSSLKRCPLRWQCPVNSPTTHLSWSLFNFNRSFVLLAENHHVTGYLVFVLVSTDWVMMCPATAPAAKFALLSVFFTLKTCATEIHCELCAVCGHNVMDKGTVRQWCRIFENGQTNDHDEERSGRPSVWMMILFELLTKKDCERLCFTISELSCEFPQMSCTVLYKIITVRLGYHKFCTRRIPKMLTGAHIM